MIFNYAKEIINHYLLLPFTSAQSVGIVFSLKRMATSIKGGESKRKCTTLVAGTEEPGGPGGL